jgi:hypothetical protein
LKKGEHLDIFDKSGKWWEARTTAGRKGSTYSSFFSILPVSDENRHFFDSRTFKLFTIVNLTTTIPFSFPYAMDGWMFSVSLKRCAFFFFVLKDSNFFYMPSNPFLLRSSVSMSRTHIQHCACGSFITYPASWIL